MKPSCDTCGGLGFIPWCDIISPNTVKLNGYGLPICPDCKGIIPGYGKRDTPK